MNIRAHIDVQIQRYIIKLSPIPAMETNALALRIPRGRYVMNIQLISRTCKIPWQGDRCREQSDWSRRKKSYEEAIQKHGRERPRLF